MVAGGGRFFLYMIVQGTGIPVRTNISKTCCYRYFRSMHANKTAGKEVRVEYDVYFPPWNKKRKMLGGRHAWGRARGNMIVRFETAKVRRHSRHFHRRPTMVSPLVWRKWLLPEVGHYADVPLSGNNYLRTFWGGPAIYREVLQLGHRAWG